MNMNNLTIRQATIDDIEKLIEVDSTAFEKNWNFQMFSDELKKDYAFYFIAEINNIPVGFAGIWCIYETAELIRIATHSEYRKTGIGNSLIKTIISKATEKSCETMLLEVRSSNKAAQALYLKNKFSQIDIRKGYYDGEDAVIMQLMI